MRFQSVCVGICIFGVCVCVCVCIFGVCVCVCVYFDSIFTELFLFLSFSVALV